jgi:acetyl-CoA carboxylase biotin carboxyl carrier protein
MTERVAMNGASSQILLADAPTADSPDGEEQRLKLLREEVGRLVRELPGSLSAVTARIGDSQLEVVWATGAAAPPDPTAAPPVPAAVVPPQAAPAPEPEQGRTVTAPLVGTFYRSPEPGARPFVEVGDRVTAGQTIGIVEAMKLMNQVASEWSGVVTEVLADDAKAVEFGQALVRIDPDVEVDRS